VIRDLRNYIFGLRPGILADRQLDQALRTLGEETQANSGSAVVVEIDSNLAARLSGRSHEIVQLTREALSNVARHANAKKSTVRLAQTGRSAVLTIEDDGSGFDTRRESSGNGLRNMRQRASALGGTLRITSKDAQGTRLRITFPVAENGAVRPARGRTTRRAAARGRVGR
jgi:two-component system, NarL family, sensor histidine kinase UhpB